MWGIGTAVQASPQTYLATIAVLGTAALTRTLFICVLIFRIRGPLRPLGSLLSLVPLASCLIPDPQTMLNVLAVLVLVTSVALGQALSLVDTPGRLAAQKTTFFDANGKLPCLWLCRLVRVGTWVPPVQRAGAVIAATSLISSTVVLGFRQGWVPFHDFTAANSASLLIGLSTAAWMASVTAGIVGTRHYGLGAISSHLRNSWEAGVSRRSLVAATLLCPAIDAGMLTILLTFSTLALGLPLGFNLLIPAVTVMTFAAAASCISPSKPWTQPGPDSAGLAFGVAAALPLLWLCWVPSLGILTIPVLALAIGGAAWVSRQTITDASFSMV